MSVHVPQWGNAFSKATQCLANGILTGPCKVWITEYFTHLSSQSLSLTDLSPCIWPNVRKQGERKYRLHYIWTEVPYAKRDIKIYIEAKRAAEDGRRESGVM